MPLEECPDFTAAGSSMIAFLLSAVFLTAATAKLDDLWAFRLTVRELLPAAPRTLTQALAVAVIAAEMLVAALFIAGSRSLGITAAAGTCALAVVFAAAYFLSRRVPHGVPCRCFGAFGLTKLSIRTVVLAVILISAAAVWVRSRGDLATFAGYAVRLLALVPALAILLVNRVRHSRPDVRYSRPDIRPVRADASAEMDGARN